MSTMIGVYLLISFTCFSFGILFWAYYTANQALKKEMSFSLEYQHALVNDAFQTQINRIGFALAEVKIHPSFQPEICYGSVISNENTIKSILQHYNIVNLDLLVITRLDGSICANASSKLFSFNPILSELSKSASNLSIGQIRHFKNSSTDLTIMLQSIPFINIENGELIGYIIGGQVLNDNLAFMENIRQKTKSKVVTFFESGSLIGSTEPITSELIATTIRIRDQRPAKGLFFDIGAETRTAEKELVFSFRYLEKNNAWNSLDIGLVTKESSIYELQSTFWESGLYLITFVIAFTLFTIFNIRRTTTLPLKALLDYSNQVLSGWVQAQHNPGNIKEFNFLGQTMEKMVTNLNRGNQQLQKEVAERKLAEKNVRQINSELDQRVRKRTGELEDVNGQLNEKIDEYESAQVELRKLSKAINQSDSTILITDINGIIEFVNPYFLKLTGYSAEEAIGQNASILSSGQHTPEFFSTMWESISNGNTWQGELINQKKNGELYWEYATISPVKTPEGKITNFVAIKDNITDRKKLEEQLKTAKERAESSDRAKSSFLANMSHEIRTPMNSIVGFTDLVLESGDLTDKQYEHLTTARNSARHLLSLINDILDISKMEAGKLDIERHPFNLPNLMLDTMKILDLTAKNKNLELKLMLPPDLYQCIKGDSYRLRQILTNLVGNSIKFTESGSIDVSIKNQENGFLLFSVKDDGIGMTSDQLKYLFQPFTQADQSTARRYGGTGLGTTISRQLVELMGGKIWVESKINQGTTFHFTLPLETPNCQSQCDSDCEERSTEGEVVQLKFTRFFKILIAEDIKENADLATIRLTQQGHSVLVVKNGQEAVDAFSEQSYDLILMDIHMPDMDGFEATRIIRKLESENQQRIPIIALTASIMTDEHQKCLDAGMDKVVGKPVQFDELFSVLEQIVPENIGQPITNMKIVVDSTDELILPVSLNGIDVKKGLNTWQDKRSYAKALKAFSLKFKESPQQLEKLIKNGNTAAAYELSHALKGVSGNLSILEVERLAIEIDLLLGKKTPTKAYPLIPELSSALNTAMKSINLIKFFDETSVIAVEDLDLEEVQSQIEQLAELCGRNEIDEELVTELLRELRGHVEEKVLNLLNDSIEIYDFKNINQAVASITRWLAEKIQPERI